jgi:hypothetical protein
MKDHYPQKDFFRFLFTKIEKTTDEKEASKLQDKFFSLIDKEFDHSGSLKVIENHVDEIKNRLDLFDQKSYYRATRFYKNFPENDASKKELKEILVDSFLRMDLAIKKEDFKVAAKNGIVQLEALLNLFQDDVIKWIESDTNNKYLKDIKRYEKDKIVTKSLSFNRKVNATKEFYFDKKYIDYSKINLLYNLRNFESHPFIGSEAIIANKNLETLSNNYSDYFRELFVYINELKNRVKQLSNC